MKVDKQVKKSMQEGIIEEINSLWNSPILMVPKKIVDRGGTVVKALCYKSECRWLDPRWCHWNFSLP
jgi:hypothetical protein